MEFKKCNYCCNFNAKPLLSDGSGIVYINNNQICLEIQNSEDNDDFDSLKINYCPICGRKL